MKRTGFRRETGTGQGWGKGKPSSLARTTPPPPGKPLERKTEIRKTSKKRQRENRERANVIRRLGEQRGPGCQLRIEGVCTGRWEHGHEILFRSSGGSITDPDNILLACDPCNGWVSDNKAEAVARGYARWSWQNDDRRTA